MTENEEISCEVKQMGPYNQDHDSTAGDLSRQISMTLDIVLLYI